MDSSPTPVPARSATTGPTRAWPVHQEVGTDIVGEVFDGRYQIVRRLAKGGMADVFLAKDRTRRCYVAIKLLRSSSPDAVRRFELEAEVLSNVQHANIVRAIAFGRTPDGQAFMALEHLKGEPLSLRLTRGPLPWREVAEIGVQIACALHALHVAGVIHRDVKPHNIILTIGDDRAIAKLIDLGLASVGAPFHDVQDARFTSQVAERRKTQLGHKIGTPAYLPPEAGLCDADPRLDVFSLGVTLYQCATGQLPDPTGAWPLREVYAGSDAPDDLSRLLLSALELDADARLTSVEHLRRGLEAILAMHPRTPAHLFGGSYDRLEMLGAGANGAVFRASDRWLSREVALKVMRAAEPSEDDAIRFRRAAKILRALAHPNIPRILHFGMEGGQHFAVTDLCAGEPAIRLVCPDRHLRVDETLAVGRQLASALAAVHAAGVVYRDLHPGNVLIARGEAPKAWIFDFDQSLVSPAFYARLTERYATPPEERLEPAHEQPLKRTDYSPPEVKAGGAFTPAGDVFVLGLLLFRLLTGLRPFPAPGGGEPTPARKLCPACPVELEQLLASMLGPDPKHRPTLDMVQAILESEQEVLAAEREAEASGAVPAISEVVAPPIVTAPPEVPAAAASATASAEPDAVAPPAATAATPDAAPEPDRAVSAVAPVAGTRTTPDAPASRVRSVLMLALLVAASVMIGRASAPRAEHAPGTLTASNTAPTVRETPPPTTGEVSRPTASNTPTTASNTPATASNTPTAASEVPAQANASPASTPPVSAFGSRRGGSGSASRASRPAVTSAEATDAAFRAVAALRVCEGVPARLTAELDVVRGRGIVTALNARAPTPDDPRFAWHACARSELERVRYPVSEATGHVRVRLKLE